MEKNIRSYLNSLIVIFIFYFATRGIVKLLWNHNNREVVKVRTLILFTCLFIGSFFYIVITYHLVNGKLELVKNLDPEQLNQNFKIQPGDYKVIYRSKNGNRTFYSVEKDNWVNKSSNLKESLHNKKKWPLVRPFLTESE